MTLLDRPVFDVANDNRCAAEPIVDSHKEIAAAESDDTPTGVGGLSTKSSRAAAAERGAVERARLERARSRFKDRQAIGDPSCAANDNEDFPLLAVLRRDRLFDYIRMVERYRGLVSLCECEPLQGQFYGTDEGSVQHVTQSLKDDTAPEVAVDAACKAGWPSDKVRGGELVHKGVRAVKPHGPTPPTQAVAATEESRSRTAPSAVRFSETMLVAQIDAKPVLAELRAALGPLLEPFEDAVLGAANFEAIGTAEGIGPKGAQGAGKALVLRGLAAVDGAWHTIAARHAREARQAAMARLRRRKELARRAAVYLGLAA